MSIPNKIAHVLGMAVEIATLTAVLYHVSKFIVWLGLSGSEIGLFDACCISIITVLMMEGLVRITGRNRVSK
jgi:hypothetical protein